MLNLKTFKEFLNLVFGKFRKEVPQIDPTIQASFARAASDASAVAAVGLQDGIQDAVNQSFPQTADDTFLELIGGYDETFRFSEQKANGFVSANGVLNTLVPQNEILTAQGNSYAVLQDAYVQAYGDSITLGFSAGIVTATTSAIHSLATGLSVDITGATQPEYNGTYIITVLDGNTFTYEITAGALTTDVGSYTSDYALLNVESITAGEDQNLEAGAVLSINVVDVDSSAYVTEDDVRGGLAEEDIEDYRQRVIEAHKLTPGIGTEPQFVFSGKKIAGNTRIFVIRATNTPTGTPGISGYIPGLGETVVYVIRDNDISIIPTQSILDATKQQFLNDGLWPTLVPESNLYVLPPIEIAQNFDFASIAPNTTTMQTAIREQLITFFEDNAAVGNPTHTIPLDDVKTFLRKVQDPTGQILESFSLTTPSTDITVSSGEISVRGSVTYA